MGIIGKIEELMESKGWTKYKLAKNSGLPQSTITSLLSGRVKSPSAETLTKLSTALGVSAAVLLGEENEIESEDSIDKKIFDLLYVLTDKEGYFYEELREDIFYAILDSNLYMAHAYRGSSQAQEYENYFKEYYSEIDEHSDRKHEEAAEEFNKAYDIRSVKTVLEFNRDEIKERFFESLKKITIKHNIKTPSRIEEDAFSESDIALLDRIKRLSDKHGMSLNDPRTLDLIDEAFDFVKRMQSK
ncbi:helix-turn-helix domain-containing protein [Paenibacillus sp. GCM10012303]|uniref:helix-turn-helix domain-containing protein n=1 Tax=Paenibacillus sp. GCM10012303 TaxID=3317340 RepID=UPI00360955BE